LYQWYDFLGNIGVAFIVSTYLLLLLNKINSMSLHYSLLNAVGAGLVTLSLFFDFNLSAFVIEAFWLIISVVGIVRAVTKPSGLDRIALMDE
jgi:hypothetical protein